MATYRVSYSRKGKVYHTTIDDGGRGDRRSKQVAINLACATSEMVPGIVAVDRNGIEVAACRKGRRVASKNPSDPYSRRRR